MCRSLRLATGFLLDAMRLLPACIGAICPQSRGIATEKPSTENCPVLRLVFNVRKSHRGRTFALRMAWKCLADFPHAKCCSTSILTALTMAMGN